MAQPDMVFRNRISGLHDATSQVVVTVQAAIALHKACDTLCALEPRPSRLT